MFKSYILYFFLIFIKTCIRFIALQIKQYLIRLIILIFVIYGSEISKSQSILYLLRTFVTISKFFFLFIFDLMALQDIINALRAKYISTKPAMMSPPEKRDKLFLTFKTLFALLIFNPFLFWKDHFPNKIRIIHDK